MELLPLAPERSGEAVELLTEAFRDYPTWRAIGPRSQSRREKAVHRYYRAELGVILRRTSAGAWDELSSRT